MTEATWIDGVTDMLGVLIAAIASIPDAVWSALLASVIALGGVLLSNRNSLRQLQIRQQHESLEKERDRRSALRNSLYLKVVEEAAGVSAYLASLPTMDPTARNLGDGLQPFVRLSSQVQLAASDETAKAMAELTAAYSELFSRLMIKAIPVHDANRQIELNDRHYDRHIANAELGLNEMRSLVQSGQADQKRFDALKASIDGYQALADQYAEARQAAYDSANAALIAYQVEMIEGMTKPADLLLELTVLLRGEIGLSTDVEAFRQTLAEARQRAQRTIDELVMALKTAAPAPSRETP